MSEELKCKCKIGKTYNPDDPECIRCKNAEKLLLFMIDRAIEKAIIKGDERALSKILDIIDE